VEPRGVILDRDKAMNLLLLALSLEVKDAGKLGIHYPLDLPQHGVAHDDRAGRGLGLKPRGKIDDVAMRGDAGAFAAVHRSEHDGAGGEADAKKRTMAQLCLDSVAGSRKAFLYLQRRATRPERSVFKRSRRAEQRQNAVASEIL